MEERERQEHKMREALDQKNEESRAKAEQNQIESAAYTQDEQSPRAKNSGKGKKTADKWNQ